VSTFETFAKRSAAPASEADRSSPDHRLVSSGASVGGHVPRQALGNELSTTPDNTNGEHGFTITHPFHPLCDHTFPPLCQRFAWGEERVFFADPQTQEIRSLPLAWTSLAPPDPFLVIADGKAVLRWSDLQQLVQFLRQNPAHAQEDR